MLNVSCVMNPQPTVCAVLMERSMNHEAFDVLQIIHGAGNVSGVKRTIGEILNVLGQQKHR